MVGKVKRKWRRIPRDTTFITRERGCPAFSRQCLLAFLEQIGFGDGEVTRSGPFVAMQQKEDVEQDVYCYVRKEF
jgi:hypothetical protein